MRAEKPTPIVILSASEWQDNPVSTMHIAALLSLSRPVIFVETPGGRLPRLREIGRIWRRLQGLLFRDKRRIKRGLNPQKVHILSPFAIPLPNSRIAAWVNCHMLSFQLHHAFKKYNIREPILWAFSPLWLRVIKKLRYKKVIFHCVDALHTYNNRHWFKSAFKELAKKADIVFTPGILLHQDLIKYNQNTYKIGHGCSTLHLNYVQNEMPEQIKMLKKPKIVYAGCLAVWVDYELLREVAIALPQYDFILLGYIHSLAPNNKVKRLISLSNVYHIGYINYNKLPAFYHQSAAGIVPYLASDEHIRYCTPTKILDYLAARLPCVSTRFPGAEEVNSYVEIADSSADFTKKLLEVIEEDSFEKRQQRVSFAKKNSWEEQVNKMLEIIQRS